VAPDAPSSDVTAIVAALKADLALDLHDSVARTLTMLVLRSEAALVRGSADDDDLEFIVRAAAEAAAQLRRALDSLGAEEAGSALRTDPPSLVETLALGQRVLRSQGFLAVITIPPNSPIEPATLAAFSGISAEAVHNMVKHGVPGSCTVDVDVRDGELRAMFANVATNEAREHGTITVSGLGMRGMSTRAVAIGGSVGVRADRTQWVVEVRLPAAGGASRRVR